MMTGEGIPYDFTQAVKVRSRLKILDSNLKVSIS